MRSPTSVPNFWAQAMANSPSFTPQEAMTALRAAGLRDRYVFRPDGQVRIEDEITLITGLCADKEGAIAAARAAARVDWKPGAMIAAPFDTRRDLDDALRLLVRHAAIMRPFNRLAVSPGDGGSVLEFLAPPPSLAVTPEWTAWAVAAGIRQSLALLGRSGLAVRVLLRAHLPFDHQEFGAILGLPVERDPTRTGLAFAPAPHSGETPPRGGPAGLSARLSDRLLAEETRHGVFGEIAARVVERLPSGEADAATVASALGASEPDLCRDLAAAGLTFRAFVDLVRFEISERLLRIPDLSLVEIAFLLGFDTQSGFAAFCRRMTDGLSAAALRRRSIPTPPWSPANRRQHAVRGTISLEGEGPGTVSPAPRLHERRREERHPRNGPGKVPGRLDRSDPNQRGL